MFKILVAEDDAELRQLFCRVLTRHGLPAHRRSRRCGGAAGPRARLYRPHRLGHHDAAAGRLCTGARPARQRRTIPVLMITARDGFQDMQFGFLAGADDYLVKPINVNELVLRINALLRRAQMVADRRQTLGTTTFEFDSFSVLTGGVQTVLPQKEFLLLYKLVSSPGHIFTRQQLMDDIWGIDTHTDPRTVDVHINRLRDRFRENQDFEIITVRGIGYKAERKHEEG